MVFALVCLASGCPGRELAFDFDGDG